MTRWHLALLLCLYPLAGNATDTPDSLIDLRGEIDMIDTEIVRLLACRYAVVDRISIVKGDKALPVRDVEREAVLLADRAAQGSSHGLDAADVRQIFESILAASRSRQTRLRNGTKPTATGRAPAQEPACRVPR